MQLSQEVESMVNAISLLREENRRLSNKLSVVLGAPLPCPFCGGQASLEELVNEETGKHTFAVSCDNIEMCGVEVFCEQDTERDAIAWWNMRAQ